MSDDEPYPDEEEEKLCFCKECNHHIGAECMDAKCGCCK